MSLYRAEIRRLSKRRFARYMVLLGLFLLAAIAAGTFAVNEKIGPEQWARAEQQAQAEYEQAVRAAEQDRRNCEEAEAAGTSDRYPIDCAEIGPPAREAFPAGWHLPATFEFREKFEPMITAWAGILALVAFAIGASFIGAEWNSGGMMNLLLWRPRRLQVLLTKLAALITGLFVLTVVSGAAWLGAGWALGTFRGTTEGMTSGAWQSLGLTGLRGMVVVLVAGVIGFALASLGRHTAVALGGVLGVLAVGQFGLAVVLELAQVRFMQKWLLPTYLLAWMDKRIVLEDWRSCQATFTGECKPKTLELVWQHSAVLMGVALLVTLGAAIWTMRQRDVA